MKKMEEESHENQERWLLTYSDLITLLMIFFVVLYAMSQVSTQKYSELANSLSIAMGGGKTLIGTNTPGSVQQTPVQQVQTQIQPQVQTQTQNQILSENQIFQNIKLEVDNYLKNNNLSGSITTQLDNRGLLIRLNDNLLFASGSADIRSDTKAKIIKLGSILNQINQYIRVEGYTDNVPIHNSQFDSNWQLSAIRATNVCELLIEDDGISPERISAVGYGQYKPIASNNTAAGRAQNRRVDIVIVKDSSAITGNTSSSSSTNSTNGTSGTSGSSSTSSASGTNGSSNTTSGSSGTSGSNSTSSGSSSNTSNTTAAGSTNISNTTRSIGPTQ